MVRFVGVRLLFWEVKNVSVAIRFEAIKNLTGYGCNLCAINTLNILYPETFVRWLDTDVPSAEHEDKDKILEDSD